MANKYVTDSLDTLGREAGRVRNKVLRRAIMLQLNVVKEIFDELIVDGPEGTIVTRDEDGEITGFEAK